MIFRQGDILLKPVQLISRAAKKKDLILAHGEVTGHCHQFLEAQLVAVYELNQQQFVDVISDIAPLVHEEHATLQIPKGKYEVVRQRELDLTDATRQVTD